MAEKNKTNKKDDKISREEKEAREELEDYFGVDINKEKEFTRTISSNKDVISSILRKQGSYDLFKGRASIHQLAVFKNEFDINVHNTYRDDMETVPRLKHYGEILATNTSTSRTLLALDGSDAQSFANDDNFKFFKTLWEYTKLPLRSAKDLLSGLSRENMAVAVFGAPFSYLEAVDPLGRVYKDLFGLRREESHISFIGKKPLMNADTKVFTAYIKIGMITQAKGQGILERAITGSAKGLRTEVENKVEVGKDATKLEEAGAGAINIANKATEKGKEAIKNSKAPETPGLVTSFALSYFINPDSGILNTNAKKVWSEKGKFVPFNKFILNALKKTLITHYSEHVNDLYNDTKSTLYNRLENTFNSNDVPFFKFICSEETIVNDTIQNQLGDSFIKGIIDKSSELSREISFVSGGGDAISIIKNFATEVGDALGANSSNGGVAGAVAGAISSFSSWAADTVREGAETVFGKDLVDMVLKGNSIIYPRVWKGTSIERMLSLQMRFYSPYGNFESIFVNVLTPLIVLMGMSMPRQVYPSFVTFPFAYSIEVPGLFQTSMAITTNISIKRGGRYDAWSDSSVMRGVDVTLDVTALKPLFGLPEEYEKDRADFGSEVSGDGKRKGDYTFANELRNMMGDFVVTDQELKQSLSNAMSKTVENIKTAVKDNTIGLFTHPVEQVFNSLNHNYNNMNLTNNQKK